MTSVSIGTPDRQSEPVPDASHAVHRPIPMGMPQTLLVVLGYGGKRPDVRDLVSVTVMTPPDRRLIRNPRMHPKVVSRTSLPGLVQILTNVVLHVPRGDHEQIEVINRSTR